MNVRICQAGDYDTPSQILFNGITSITQAVGIIPNGQDPAVLDNHC
jgi:hypothetical protein